jgi:hypothetical protein
VPDCALLSSIALNYASLRFTGLPLASTRTHLLGLALESLCLT